MPPGRKRGAFFAVLVLAGCAKPVKVVAPRPSFTPISCLVVLPFENYSGDPGAGEAFSDLLATEIYRSGVINVMDRAEAQRILSVRGIWIDPVKDADYAQQLGIVLGVRGVVMGSVSDWRWTEGPGGKHLPVIAGTVRLIDVRTGHELWHEVLAEEPALLSAPEDSLYRAAQRVAASAADELATAVGPGPGGDLPPRCWQPKVTAVKLSFEAPLPRPRPSPIATAEPVAAANGTPQPTPTPLTPSQQALLSKMTIGAQFVLEGVTFPPPPASTLLDTATPTLSDLAAVLAARPGLSIRLEAYVDPTDPNAVNLSQKRANAVVSRLLTLGAPAGGAIPKGMGGTRSLFPSFVPAMKAKNRRVELAVISVAVPVVEKPAPPPPASAPTAEPRVKVVAGAGTTGPAIKLVNDLKAGGTQIVSAAAIPDPRANTELYFRPGFDTQAQKLADQVKIPGGPKLFQYEALGEGIDVLIVVGSDLP